MDSPKECHYPAPEARDASQANAWPSHMVSTVNLEEDRDEACECAEDPEGGHNHEVEESSVALGASGDEFGEGFAEEAFDFVLGAVEGRWGRVRDVVGEDGIFALDVDSEWAFW